MLEIREVTKRYGEKFALREVSLSLAEGVYGLLGPNGAGKSTLMNIITGNLAPDSGEVLWDGAPIGRLGAEYRALLGYAPQQQGLYETFTGRRFLSYLGTLKELPRGELPGEIQRAAALVNLTDRLDRPIGTYSGGMKQRLLIAQAMLGSPRLVVLDEPTAGLDPRERVRIRETLHELSAGRILLVATHVVSDIQSIAREIVVLKAGQVLAKAPVEELCRGAGAGGLEEVYLKLFGEEADHE